MAISRAGLLAAAATVIVSFPTADYSDQTAANVSLLSVTQLGYRFRDFALSGNATLGKSLLSDNVLKQHLSSMIDMIAQPKSPRERTDPASAGASSAAEIAIAVKNELQKTKDFVCIADTTGYHVNSCGEAESSSRLQQLLNSWDRYLRSSNSSSHLLANIVLPFLEYVELFKNDKAYRKLAEILSNVRNACMASDAGWQTLYNALDSKWDNNGTTAQKKDCHNGNMLNQCMQSRRLVACFVFHSHLADAVFAICDFTEPHAETWASPTGMDKVIDLKGLQVLTKASKDVLDSILSDGIQACVCRKNACLRLAKLLQRQIDFTARPCDDFYGYVCGGFTSRFLPTFAEMQEQMKEKYTPAVRKAMPRLIVAETIKSAIRKAIESVAIILFLRNKSLPDAVRHAKLFYDKCMQYRRNCTKQARMARVVNFIKNFTSQWPFFNNNSLSAVENTTDVYGLLGELLGSCNIAPLIRLTVFEGMDSFMLEPALFGVPVNLALKQVFVHRVETVKKSLRFLASAEDSFPIPEITVNVTAHEVVQMEKALSVLSSPDFLLAENASATHVKSLAAAYTSMPELRPFFDNAFRNEQDLSQVNANESGSISAKTVVFMSLGFIDQISKLMRSPLSKRTLVNMIMVRMLEELAFMFDEDLRDPLVLFEQIASRRPSIKDTRFLEDTTGVDRKDLVPEREKHSDRCVRETRDHFTAAVDRLYVASSFLGEKHETSQGILRDVKAAAREMLAQTDLITMEETRKRFLDKLDVMQIHPGFHKVLFNDSHLNQRSPKRVAEDVGYFRDTLLNLRKWDYERINDMQNESEELCVPITSPDNACFTPIQIAATIPAGMFEFPFFDVSFPKSFQFGLVGFVAGHEIFHGFDDDVRISANRTGADADHLLSTDREKHRFRERQECLLSDANSTFCYEISRYQPLPSGGDYTSISAREVSMLLETLAANAAKLDSDSPELYPIGQRGEHGHNESCLRSAVLPEIMSDLSGLKACHPGWPTYWETHGCRQVCWNISYAPACLKPILKKVAFKAIQHMQRAHGPDLKLPGLEQYSSEQLFFLAFGTFFCEPSNPFKRAVQLTKGGSYHMPPDARVNLAVRHSPDFADAFQCKRSDQLALREKACRIF